MTFSAVTGEILDATDIASYAGCTTDKECYATVDDPVETSSDITSTTITANTQTELIVSEMCCTRKHP